MTIVISQLQELHAIPNEAAGDKILLLPFYKEYPARIFPPSDPYDPYRPPSPSKGYPETNSAAILSALGHLQEKIRRLELENKRAERRDAQRTVGVEVIQRNSTSQTDKGRAKDDLSSCNKAVMTQLTSAESRCANLERQLDHMRTLLRNARGEKSHLKHQVTMGVSKSSQVREDTASAHAHLKKMLQLEQEYLRLTRTQAQAEVKIHQLEQKLQEEEHQRKLVQDKLQSGLDVNGIFLRPGYLPQRSTTHPRERKGLLKARPSCFEPHYRLNLRDVPFVAGTSVGGSHSVRANVQSVLSLLKHHQPELCNNRVLGVHSHTKNRRSSDTSSSATSSNGGELTELLQMLRDELRVMSLEQDELIRQLERHVPLRERKQLERQREALLLKIERKGEQIAKLYKHKLQMKKVRKEASRYQGKVKEAKPGEKSKRNLKLLKDMKALQTSLRT
ncbi:centrosomal protein of 57 kDa isoform X2 [Stigmatopora nigra]